MYKNFSFFSLFSSQIRKKLFLFSSCFILFSSVFSQQFKPLKRVGTRTGALTTASSFWNTTGNSGNDATNFLGTTDNAPLIFKVNNQWAGKLDPTLQNTFFGQLAGNISSAGKNNTAIGFYSMNFNQSGHDNSAFGSGSLSNNSSGNYNTSLGNGTLYNNTTGSNNAAGGYAALFANTNGFENTAFGNYTLRYNISGNDNTATGSNALRYNTSGNNNTATGYASLYNNTDGSENTALGNYTLNKHENGDYNTATGSMALQNDVFGSYNTATGYQSLNNNKLGYSNSAFGAFALKNNIGKPSIFGYDGVYNTAVGVEAMALNVTGAFNSAFGAEALYNNSTGIYLTGIGAYTDVSVDGLTNATAIGFQAIVNQSNKVRIGNTDVTVIEGQVPFSTISDGRFKESIDENVPGLEFINKLRPVTYQVNTEKLDHFLRGDKKQDSLHRSLKMPSPSNAGASKIRWSGFIAQEVEKAADAVNYKFSGLYIPKNAQEHYSLSYETFVVPLVAAVQKLSKKNDELEEKITKLEEQMNQLQALVTDKTSVSNVSVNNVTLEQNAPNPFNNTTTITYNIPFRFQSAQLLVTDIAGNTLKTIPVTARSGEVNIEGSLLSNGSYSYSLIIDGHPAQTRKMVVAKQ